MQKPKASRIPASGKPTAKYSRGKLGEPLNAPFAEFDLTVSNLKCGAYNCFHNPLLKSFFMPPERKKQLLKHRLVTEDDKGLCSLKELNQNTKYIKSVQQNWNKLLLKEEKLLLKDLIQELREEGRIYQVPVGASKLGAAMSAQPSPHAPAGAPKGPAFPNTAEQVASKKRKGAGDRAMMVKVLQHSEHKPAMVTEEREARSSHSELAKKLVSSVLRKIQESPGSDFSPSETSSDESSEVQSFSGSCASSQMNSSPSLYSEALIVSPTSEVAVDLVRDALMKIQDSPGSDLTLMDLEMSADSLETSGTSSPISSCLDEQIVSPTSEAAVDLISGVLGEIQESPGSDRDLPEMPSHECSELQSFSELKGTVESPNHLRSLVLEGRRSSPASYEGSERSLMDFQMSSDSRPESPTSSPAGLGLDTQIPSASEASMDLVNGFLRNIQELPCSDWNLPEPPSILSLELQSFADMGKMRSSPASIASSDATLMDLQSLRSSDSGAQSVSPTSEASMDLVNGIQRKIEDSPCSDLGLLDSAPTSENNSAGKKRKSRVRKQIFAFVSRSWESVRPIFISARCSNRVHVQE